MKRKKEIKNTRKKLTIQMKKKKKRKLKRKVVSRKGEAGRRRCNQKKGV
jgi:hypothetical protein